MDRALVASGANSFSSLRTSVQRLLMPLLLAIHHQGRSLRYLCGFEIILSVEVINVYLIGNHTFIHASFNYSYEWNVLFL